MISCCCMTAGIEYRADALQLCWLSHCCMAAEPESLHAGRVALKGRRSRRHRCHRQPEPVAAVATRRCGSLARPLALFSSHSSLTSTARCVPGLSAFGDGASEAITSGCAARVHPPHAHALRLRTVLLQTPCPEPRLP